MKAVFLALIISFFLLGCAASAPPHQQAISAPDSAMPSASGEDVPSANGEDVPSVAAEDIAALARQEEAVPPYDFSQPAPETLPAPDDYFSTAAFIGDSRTEGLLLFGGIAGEDLTYNGLTIFNLFTKQCIRRNGQYYTILEILETERYEKIYLSLGVNELGYPYDEKFYAAYQQAVDTLRAVQPQAVLYLQGLIPLNESVIKSTGGPDYLTNRRLETFDALIRQVAQEKQVIYLDLNTFFQAQDGSLPAEASSDGIHLRAAWCKQWADYLKTHTVPGGAQEGVGAA